jgi:hypothetical protein
VRGQTDSLRIRMQMMRKRRKRRGGGCEERDNIGVSSKNEGRKHTIKEKQP